MNDSVHWLAVVGVVLLVEIPLLGGAFLLLRALVHDSIARIEKMVQQSVALADSADGQYQALRTRVGAVEQQSTQAVAAVQRLEGDVRQLQRRVGLPSV